MPIRTVPKSIPATRPGEEDRVSMKQGNGIREWAWKSCSRRHPIVAGRRPTGPVHGLMSRARRRGNLALPPSCLRWGGCVPGRLCRFCSRNRLAPPPVLFRRVARLITCVLCLRSQPGPRGRSLFHERQHNHREAAFLVHAHAALAVSFRGFRIVGWNCLLGGALPRIPRPRLRPGAAQLSTSQSRPHLRHQEDYRVRHPRTDSHSGVLCRFRGGCPRRVHRVRLALDGGASEYCRAPMGASRLRVRTIAI